MSGRKAAASASPPGELKSPFDSADGELAISFQPIATAAATVPTVCQPANPTERVTLSREEIYDLFDRARAQNEELNATDFDLRPWVALESLKQNAGAVLRRKLAVAFAIGRLLQHLKNSVSSYSQDEVLRLCSVDNFTVKMVANSAHDEVGWEVIGIDMISPRMSIQVKQIPPSSDAFEDRGDCIDAVVTRHSPFCCAKQTAKDESENNLSLCYALGLLVKFVFSNGSTLGSNPNSPENPQETQGQSTMYDFLRALSISPSSMNTDTNGLDSSDGLAAEPSRPTKLIRMSSPQYCLDQGGIPSLGVPNPIARLVIDLLACQQVNDDIFQTDTSPVTLDAAIDDLNILLTRPDQFLFGASQQLQVVKTIYGRSSESSALLEVFRRVSTSGQSEAFFVKGCAGSGKTSLVQGVVNEAIAARGLVVQKKFEENSTNQLYLVLSAFNDLCKQLAEIYCFVDGGASSIWQKFVMEFGSSLHILSNILPNVIGLTPSPSAAFSLAQGINGDINFFSLCDLIKRFMRVLSSSSSIPVLMVLDDLQWSDPASLGLVHTVLSDMIGASCMFFVGIYRDNEVPEHHIVHGFHSWLSACNVAYSAVHLGGLPQQDVLSLISDSLGMLPRLCLSLSQVVYRKTEGNPLFVQTFLHSIVDKRLLEYSPLSRDWVWDIDEIYDEGITPNVLDLLGAKMAACSSGVKVALKVAACFGIKVGKSIVEKLSGTSQYPSLLADLNKAVDDGIMDFDGSNYKFAHDKVREAAYDMIHPDARNEFHFDIGMLLYSGFKRKNVGADDTSSFLLYSILNQINHGVPALLQDEEQRAMIAKMNYDVATQMIQSYNYTTAYQFADRSVALLPEDCWSQNHDRSTDAYFLLSKAAFSNGKTDIAMSAVNKVIEHQNSKMKLDAYVLKLDILWNSCVPSEAAALLETILDVLDSLGENLEPMGNLCESTIGDEIRLVSDEFQNEPDVALLHASRVDSGHKMLVMEAYHILAMVAYLVKPTMLCFYFNARWARYTIRNKVICKYTPVAYVAFAATLCKVNTTSYKNMKLGQRIGKLGLKILQDGLYESMFPLVHCQYYSLIGCLFEPLQAVIDMHQQTIDLSLKVGNSSMAALNKAFLFTLKLRSGTNLCQLKEEFEREMNVQHHPGSSTYLQVLLRELYEGVCALIGNETSGLSQKVDDGSDAVFDNEQSPHNLSRMMYCCYLGFHERTMHLAKRWEVFSNSLSPHQMPRNLNHSRTIYSCFYYGLSYIGIRRKRNFKQNLLSGNDTASWLNVVNCAARCSKYNFENKRALLMAEKLSYLLNNDEAEAMYDIAIKASKSSHFIQEEALSYELAGAHYERLEKFTKALELYKQAECCYEIWGSVVKTCQMKEKIKDIGLNKNTKSRVNCVHISNMTQQYMFPPVV